MDQIRYFTQKTVEELRASVSRNLDWYYKPDGTEFPRRIPSEARRDTSLPWRELGSLLAVGSRRPYESDAENAMIVYETLRDLTPQQASDERLWVQLSHGDCADYTAKRWLASRPDNPDTAVKRVLSHFFARDSRALIRDHAVSRLWWLGGDRARRPSRRSTFVSGYRTTLAGCDLGVVRSSVSIDEQARTDEHIFCDA